MIEDYVSLAIGHLKRKKVRSSLTIIGIFISIATIFILISISLGFDAAVKEQFRQLGTDKIMIMPKGQAGAPGSGGAVQLTTKDFDVVEKVKGVERASYASIGNAKITYGDKNRYYMVIGVPMDSKSTTLLFESMGIKIDEGRPIKSGEKKKILMGYSYKYGNLFSKPIRQNYKIGINGVEFEVVGILKSVGNPSDDQMVYLSYEDFQEVFNSGERVDEIFIQTKQGEDVNKIADEIKRKLMSYRGVKEKTIDFTITTPEELLKSFGTVLNIITAFLLGIAFISLLVGCIGIANTMYTSVLERTNEIGTMKAIGAKNSDILLIFVIESGILGLIGGFLGVVFGIIVGKIVDFIAINYIGTNLLRTATPLWLILGCWGFAFFIGAISGFLPARQASKIRPADTLRYE